MSVRGLEDGRRRTGELVWRLPLHQQFADMMKGRYAQLTNRSWRREAFPVTAAEFLHHFAGELLAQRDGQMCRVCTAQDVPIGAISATHYAIVL